MLKKIILILVIILFFINSPLLTKRICSPDVPVDRKIIKAHVQFLTDIKPFRNYQNISSLDRAAEYISEKFKKYSQKVVFQKYQVHEEDYKNVIASFNIRNDQRIIIGAHYDVCGNQPGADDNASGIAAILELARLINILKPVLRYRLDLVAFALEEPPYFRTRYMGSAVHARVMFESKVRIKLMISLDMIGFFTKTESQFFSATAIIGRQKDKRILKKVRKYMITNSKLEFLTFFSSPASHNIDLSDHLNYLEHNYRAILISTYPISRNPYYHSSADTIKTLNFQGMSEVIKGIYRLVINF